MAVGAVQTLLVVGLQVGLVDFLQTPGAAAAIGRPAALAARLAPELLAYLAIGAPIYGALAAFYGAPWASALRDLAPDTSAVFA
jgi:hypothetical protein